MTTSAFIYLQAAPAQGSPNIMTSLLPLILVFVVFIFHDKAADEEAEGTDKLPQCNSQG